MSKTIQFTKNSLTYGDVSKIFPDEILQALDTPAGVLVIFDWKRLGNRGIFLFNDKLEQIWQIEEMKGSDKLPFRPYTGIVGVEGDTIKVYNGVGFLCDVDLNSGAVTVTAFTK